MSAGIGTGAVLITGIFCLYKHVGCMLDAFVHWLLLLLWSEIRSCSNARGDFGDRISRCAGGTSSRVMGLRLFAAAVPIMRPVSAV